MSKSSFSIVILTLCFQVVFSQATMNDAFWSEKQNKSFSLIFDNDTYYLTDFYYSQGLEFEIVLPVFNGSPFVKMLSKHAQNSQCHSGVSIAQRLYTPKNIRDTLVQFGDRPFAATLEMDHFTKLLNQETGILFNTRLRLGIMGPVAGGKQLQQLIHDWIDSPEANGWKYEIANDIILNYDIGLKIPLVYLSSFAISGAGQARIGTLFDDLSVGINMAAGKNLFNANAVKQLSKPSTSMRFTPYVNINTCIKWVGYNATMQGGLFSPNDAYVLTYREITPWVFTASAQVGFIWKKVSLSYAHCYLTKEFDLGSDHQYGSFELKMYF